MRHCAAKLLTTRQAGSLVVRLCGLSVLVLTICAARAEPQFATDSMSDNELRAFRNQMRNELQRLLETAPSEETGEGKAYRVYYCTI